MKSNKNDQPHVYLIDDNPAVLFLHDLMLEESGISERAQKFDNAEDALIQIRKKGSETNPLLVFLDINMPKMDGWGFMDALEKSGIDQEIFIVMVSPSINLADKEIAKRYGKVIQFIEKPLNLELCQDLKNHPKLRHLFSGL